jgi:hypothetical protein
MSLNVPTTLLERAEAAFTPAGVDSDPYCRFISPRAQLLNQSPERVTADSAAGTGPPTTRRSGAADRPVPLAGQCHGARPRHHATTSRQLRRRSRDRRVRRRIRTVNVNPAVQRVLVDLSGWGEFLNVAPPSGSGAGSPGPPRQPSA